MSHDPFSRRLPRSIAALALGGLLACAAAAVHAATATVAIGFDTDDNPGTGCTLTLGAASLPGIEVALHTVVTTTATTGTVGAVTRRTCAGGVFGAPVTVSAGGWAVGLGAGLDGSDLVETFIPLADLGGAGAAKIGAVTPGDSLLAASAMVLLDPQPAVRVPIPALSPPALLLLLFLVGGTGWLMRRYARQGGRVLLLVCVVAASLTTASALAIIFDGNGADWTGVVPLATDTSGDAPAGEDLVALYAVKDGANLALRVDLALARDPANQAPVANAGTNQTITLPATAMLSGSATDDGLPDPPATLTYAWAKFSGPGTVMFGNAASPTTSAGFSADGTYVLRLTVSDSALAHSADVTITVNAAGAANLAPIVNAGANQAITLPAAATLAGTATDDGLPLLPGTLTIGWSLVSGPGAAVTFGNPAAPATTATFQAPGTYMLRLTASDGALSAASDVQITVSDGAPLLFTVADRTIALGTRYQQLLVAGDANIGDTLTYSLLSAPAGAALSPSPLVDWVPTAAQLGMNTFTARVTDAAGHSATTTFHVTVVHTNRPPQLAPQSNVILPVGTAFTRTLQATDPDAGDTLTFALVSGPMGMTRTGAVLDWNTAGKAPGDYPVSVNVTDAGGLSDGKVFTVTLTPPPPPPAAPVANDDSYSVKIGQTLTVTPAGVLANDTDANGDALTANRLSDPAVGTLTTFNANGSFTFAAPAVVPGAPLTIAKMWNTGSGGSDRYHELVADLNGDGYPDVISFDNNGGIRARSGQNGNQLWSVNNAGATDCRLNSGGGSMDQRVLADLDDSGHPALAHTTTCTRSGGGWADHIVAYSHLGTVKWVSPPLSKPHPDVRHGATPVPPGGFTPGGLAWQRGLSVGRLTAGGAPVLLMRVEIPHNDGYTYYVDAANQFHYAGCRAVTGLVADENVACRATLIISGTDGSVLDTLVVRNPAAVAHFGGPGALSEMPPIAMDIDGDGRVDLVSGTEVWMQNAGGGFDFAWQLNLGVNDTAVADLDGDGKAEIIHIRSSGQANFDDRGIFIYSHDGQLQRRIPLWTYWFTPLTIADVDGDGRPDIVLGGDGTVYAFRDDGRPIWAHKVPPDVPSDPVLAPFYVQPGPGSGVANAAPQVYDLDGDGVAEVVVAAYSRIIILDGRTGVPKTDPFWTFNFSYNDVSALILADVNNDGHVDIVQNAAFNFNCLNPGVAPACAGLVGPIALSGGGANNWLPGPKAWPNVQYRSTAIDDNARVLHDTTVSRIFRVPVQRGSVRDPRLAEGTSFTYAASDGTATSAPATVFIEIVPDNQPPVFTSVPPKSLWQRFGPTPPGGLVTHYYDLAAVDPDPGDTITFSLKAAPTWVTLSGPARIRFEPTCGSYGYPCPWGWTTVIVTATDSRGAATDQIFIVNLTTSSVTVPNVVGMALDAAQTALVASELQGVQWVESFAAQPAGTVLAQDAVAGAVVGRFDDIKLTVSKGPKPALVPFVVGMTLAMANGQLAGLGFTAAVTPEFSTTIPVNQVMAQSPAAGTPLLPVPANPVALTVSSGPPLAGTVVQVVVEPGPTTRLAGEDQQYKATAVFADGTSTDVTLSSLWLSTVTSVATVNAFGAAHAVGAGATLLRATVAGVTGETTLNVVAGVTGDNVPPSASITAPANGSAVTASIQVTGTATDANFLRYELAVAAAGDAAWTLIGEGTSPVANGALATFDPTTLVNDLYTIRLTVFDRGGNQSEATTTVQLSGQRKIGPFNLTFTDLKIPMAGVPITVNRTYDSRDKAQGDFGIGWRLGLQTLRLRSNRVLGTGWVRNVMGVSVTLAATDEHKVSLTLPDGRVEEFDMVVSPTANIGSLDATSVIGFIARSGTMGKLVALVNNDLLILGGGAEDELVDDSTLNTYDPQLYRYTGVDGVQIEIHKSEGVKKITDLDGNTLTIGAGGIVHSGGKSVLFTRDPQGRITQITDPLGKTQSYTYDGNGDLVTHVDAVGNASRYKYDRNHGLIDIQDPAGNHPARNEYDTAGRLLSTTDANGNQILFTHNVGSTQEVVRDRLGNPTTYGYDAAGNIVSKTNALGQTWTYTYDSRNNRLSETDPLGRVATRTYDSRNNVLTSTDFEGGVTVNTYNALGQPLTTIDPEGRTTTRVFNAAGKLTQSTDPEGGVTKFTYDGAGNVLTRTNPLNQVTSFTYDTAGNKTSQTDPLGHTTATTYDGNGNALTVTDPAGNTEHRAYDAAGRLVSLTDKLGKVTTLTYSTVGNGRKVASRTDPAGNVTSHDYDLMGNVLKTTHPDGAVETKTYDAEGRVLTDTNRDGHTTVYQYDVLGRKTRTTHPGGAFTQATWDAADRMLTQTDERGNVTTYAYAPSQTTITDPLGHAAIHEFDSQRRRIKLTDALGHETSFTYDSEGKLLRTTFPNGSFKTTTYDAAKRKAAETDQAGRTTQFTYDAAGRLTQVTNMAGGVTAYTYDAVDNQLTQTDANGHTTQLAYDAERRVVSRTRPSGKQETFIHDANGNVLSHTDFNAQTTSFTVDAMGRVIKKMLPGGGSVSFAWTPGGLRAQAGGDTYAYDARGKLLQDHKASGETLVYTYDAAGNKTSVTTPLGTITSTYDAANRLATVNDGSGATTYTYDAVGNLAGVAYPNGVTAAYAYDMLNRLVLVANTGPGGLISSYAYTLGAAGNRTQVVESGPATAARTIAYTYDLVYRLTQESIAQASVPNVTIGYTYDAVGNRTQMNRNGAVTNYSYDSNDRLIAETGPAATFTSTWDDNGNLKSRGNGSGTETYAWDAENRMVGSAGAAGIAGYGYDADGMRISRTVGGVTTTFLVDKVGTGKRCGCRGDAGEPLSQVVVETRGATVIAYTHGNMLISQQQPGSGASYYLTDGQLSIRQLANTAGAVTDTYDFDAFGVLLASTGSTPNVYLYAGEQFDPNVGFYYLRARYYQQSTGRFVSTDPELGSVFEPASLHRYLYAHGDPVNFRDPTGRFEVSLANLTFTSGLAISVGAGILTMVGTHALGVAKDWREAFGYGVQAAVGVAIALAGGYVINVIADLMKAGATVSQAFLSVYVQSISAGELVAAEQYLAGYVARRFLYSTAARCVFLDALMLAVPGFILLGVSATENYGQSIATITTSSRDVFAAAARSQIGIFAASIGCT